MKTHYIAPTTPRIEGGIHHCACGQDARFTQATEDAAAVTCGACLRVLDSKRKQRTATRAFGTGRRQGHNASAFYGRAIYDGAASDTPENGTDAPEAASTDWIDRIYLEDARRMSAAPQGGVALAFTSPPYNVGKEYDADLSMAQYRKLLIDVAKEVWRVLLPGGRYVINVANLGRKPYIPLHALIWQDMQAAGWLPMGEIIWRKAKGAGGSCAWGSWRSARAPRLRDVHEYLLVFAKQQYHRPDRGESDIGRDEFMNSTLSVWEIAPESAKRIGHPAPFPLALAERVIRLYSYRGDVVLDPFAGSGTTLVAAKRTGRHYVGYDIMPEYVALAENRLNRTDVL